MTDDRPGDPFARYDPNWIQILGWVAISLLLYFFAEPLVVPYLGASMVLVSTYLFVSAGYPLARTLAWTVPSAALFVASVVAEGWVWALLTYLAVLIHAAFYLVPRLRTAWYHGSA